MKLAVITETFYPFEGGSSRRYLEVLKRLVRKGYEVDLYTVRLRSEWKIKENVEGINVLRTEQVMEDYITCLLYTSPSPRDGLLSRMPSSA